MEKNNHYFSMAIWSVRFCVSELSKTPNGGPFSEQGLAVGEIEAFFTAMQGGLGGQHVDHQNRDPLSGGELAALPTHVSVEASPKSRSPRTSRGSVERRKPPIKNSFLCFLICGISTQGILFFSRYMGFITEVTLLGVVMAFSVFIRERVLLFLKQARWFPSCSIGKIVQ